MSGLWDVTIDGAPYERPMARERAERLQATILKAEGRKVGGYELAADRPGFYRLADGRLVGLERFSDNRCPRCGDLWIAHDPDGSCVFGGSQ